MAQFHDGDFWHKEIQRLLDVQEPEDFHLEYKDKEALLPKGRGGGGLDTQKRGEDVSKDVSAFLNSQGGSLIYGVPETEDLQTTGGAPIPSALSSGIGFAREGGKTETVTKETLEHLVTDNIQPKPSANQFQVTEVPFRGRIIFVVEIAPGIGQVWQAKDKRYYQRYNFQNLPMDHYQIEMVRSRGVSPSLQLVFGFNAQWEKEVTTYGREEIEIFVGVQNVSNSVAETALLELGISEILGLGPAGNSRDSLAPFVRTRSHQVTGVLPRDLVEWYECSWPVHGDLWRPLDRPIFKTLDPIQVLSGSVKIPLGRISDTKGFFVWRVQTPNAVPNKAR